MKFIITLSLILLSLSTTLADYDWTGGYTVTSQSQDPDCCFPKSDIILYKLGTQEGYFVLLEGYWESSAGCDAASISGSFIDGSDKLNYPTLNFQDAGIPTTVTRDGSSITLTTESNGKVCNATLTNDTTFTWVDTYSFTPDLQSSVLCCNPKTLTITQNSAGKLDVSGVWNQTTGSCNLPDEYLAGNDGVLTVVVNELLSSNFDKTEGVSVSMSLTQWQEDFIPYKLTVEVGFVPKMECNGVAKKVQSAKSLLYL